MRRIALYLGLGWWVSTGAVSHAADAKPGAAPPAPYPERIQWWTDARFGMFIHWGPVSLKGTEISWSRANSNPKCPNRGEIPVEVYDNLYKEFNPAKFDAAQWVGVAKAAGVGYMVLTAKHCDGFLLWHSRASDYNISRTPFQRDVCDELTQAARQQGMRIGWYFSPMDWRDPDFRTERNPAFLARMQSEVRELLGNYGRIDLLWFDWDGHEPLYAQAQTYQIVKTLQPRIVINNRLDLGVGDNDRKILSTNADYYTPEQIVGAYDDQRPWESCMTISRKGQWAWGGATDGVKSFRACLEMLIRCAGGDGNMLFNVGPTPAGEIDPEQAAILKQMGGWLAKHGESIYRTRGGPFKPGSYGVSTRKGRTIYLHITDWLEDSLKLPPIPAKVVSSSVLGGAKAEVRQTGEGLEVAVRENDRQSIDTVVAIEIDRPALDIVALDVPEPVSLTTKGRATASNIYRNQPEYAADKAIDGRDDTRWAADAGVKAAYLDVDLGKIVRFSRARISEAFPNRVQKFEFQYLDGAEWKTFLTGTTLGESWSRSFPAVTAQKVRLAVLESTDGPTIWEFSLFP
ncbi:MAG TPA: alpha-L-fucosidase [Verrucomicrobiae bacterium]